MDSFDINVQSDEYGSSWFGIVPDEDWAEYELLMAELANERAATIRECTSLPKAA